MSSCLIAIQFVRNDNEDPSPCPARIMGAPGPTSLRDRNETGGRWTLHPTDDPENATPGSADNGTGRPVQLKGFKKRRAGRG
ncbi:hypothetical protein Aph02nite_57520 [Actinoplanes philippinensis]|nr:hypothetical protein Aph02nite_57520 [Actinoplanes philippinensis]